MSQRGAPPHFRVRRSEQVGRAAVLGLCVYVPEAGQGRAAARRREARRGRSAPRARTVAGHCSHAPTAARTSSTSHCAWLCAGGSTCSSATCPSHVVGTRRGAAVDSRGRALGAGRRTAPPPRSSRTRVGCPLASGRCCVSTAIYIYIYIVVASGQCRRSGALPFLSAAPEGAPLPPPRLLFFCALSLLIFFLCLPPALIPPYCPLFRPLSPPSSCFPRIASQLV